MALWYAGIVMEVAVAVILYQRRIYRLLPIFFIYLVWVLVSDAAEMLVHLRAPAHYVAVFVSATLLDSTLQFAVLVELGWSVLRPVRSALPRGAIFALAGLLLLAGIAVWPIAGITALHNLTSEYRLMYRLVQTISILRILFFVILAAFSQLLAIGWRHRELQVATGLGIYSVASLGAALLHAQLSVPAGYHLVDQLVVMSYLCSLAYWAYSFLQKEAPRQEFTPRMQAILLTVSGAARADRVAMQDLRKQGK